MEVSINTQQFSADGVTFEYQHPSRVLAVAPSRGPAGGGTLVVVHGMDFSERAAALGTLQCRFGTATTPAAFLTATSLRCHTPVVR